MPLVTKLSPQSPDGKPNCPRCDSNRVWCHGSYYRKGFHRRNQGLQDLVLVLRFLCRSGKGCGTFSLLPRSVLPYCRFFFRDFLAVFRLFQQGLGVYAIWSTCGISGIGLGVIGRLVALFRKVLVFAQSWCRELDAGIQGGLGSLCGRLLRRWSWAEFAGRWYHALYPLRV